MVKKKIKKRLKEELKIKFNENGSADLILTKENIKKLGLKPGGVYAYDIIKRKNGSFELKFRVIRKGYPEDIYI